MSTAQETTLAAEVYGIVRRRIMRGDLPPGQPISRRTVAAEVRTSLLPVAEAMHRLEFEGLLESRPRAGTRVRIPSQDDVKGHYVVREALEVQAAIRVATVASAGDLAKLRAHAERVDELRLEADRFQFATAHHAFHRRLAELGRCRQLCDALEQAHAFAALWFSRLQVPQPDDSATPHVHLVEAIASRDPGAAAEAVRAHVAHGYERSMHALEPWFEEHAVTRTFHRRRRSGPAANGRSTRVTSGR
jgi:DNA-binding GntR family transcriptional regulator